MAAPYIRPGDRLSSQYEHFMRSICALYRYSSACGHRCNQGRVSAVWPANLQEEWDAGGGEAKVGLRRLARQVAAVRA